MKIPPKVLELADALKRAKAAAEKIPVRDGGGTCNFDAPMVELKRWLSAHVEAAAALAGLRCYKRTGRRSNVGMGVLGVEGFSRS